jgi:hypothetical protein
MRISESFVAAVCVFALATGAAAQQSSSAHDELAVWAGHWKIHIETKETQFGHAKTEDYDGKCAFLPHGAFMVCEFLSLQPDSGSGRIINDVSLFYYSEVDKTFKYTNVGPEGGPHEDVLLVDGNVWTKSSEIQKQRGGVVNLRQIWTFVSPHKRVARLEVSIDKGGHWTVVNESIGTKES